MRMRKSFRRDRACQLRPWIMACAVLLLGQVEALSDPNELLALSVRAHELTQAGKISAAIPLAQRAAEIAKQDLGEDSPPYATAINRLADLYRLSGRWDDAEKLLKRARAIREKSDPDKVVDTQSDLGLLYWGAGKYAQAEPLLKQALEQYKARYGADDPFVATSSTNLALLYGEQARYGDAEKLLADALRIRKTKLGPDDLDVANSLSNMASLARRQAHYQEAEDAAKSALAIREKKLTADHPDIATALNVLAEIYRAEGQYALAEPLLNRALQIRKKAFGPDHTTVATTLNSLGSLYEGQGRVREAEKAYKDALAIWERLAPDHPDLATARSNLGALYAAQARYTDAEPLLRTSLASREKTLGERHPDYIRSLLLLGELLKNTGRTDEAETQFQRALLLRRDAIREINVYFATNRNKVGNASRVTFGGERADELSVGYASVWISEPSASATARAPSSAGSRPSASPDETTAVTRLVIKNVTKTTDQELVRAAAPQVRSSARYPGRALIFVHGFNVSFDNALFRAAQIAYDLNFDGPVFLFSWPSRGEAGALGSVLAIRHYPYDRESADEAVQYFVDFLKGDVAKAGATKIDLIAHSMGNKPMLEALERLQNDTAARQALKIGEVVMAAPDVEVSRFKQLIKAAHALGAQLTLYASANDNALRVSQWVWGGGKRAGYVASGGFPVIVPDVDSIDISTAGASPFGLNHDVYVSNPVIFKDLRLLLERGARPPDRRTSAFALSDGSAGKYWIYRQGAPVETGSPH